MLRGLLRTAGFVLLLGLGSTGRAEGVAWQTDLEAAKREAAASGKLVLVHFWASWCGPCMQMETTVFRRDEVGAALAANYVPVKVNVDQNRPLAQQYQVQRIPVDLVLLPSGQLVQKLEGQADPVQYVGRMNALAAQLRGGPAPQVAAAPPAASGGQPLVGPRYANYGGGPPVPPAAPSTPPAAGPPLAPMVGPVCDLQGNTSLPQAPAAPPAPAVPPQVAGPPIFGLEGHCPVTLLEKKSWQRGDVRYGAIHRGVTYLFAGPQEQQKFLATPDVFAPVQSGHDVVLAVDQGQHVPGIRRHGVFYNQRIYLFSSEDSLARFWNNPLRYQTTLR